MNRKRVCLVVAVAVMVLPVQASADGINPAIVQSLRQLSVGAGSLEQAYQEFNRSKPGLPAVLDSETGSIDAYRLDYANVHGRYAYGIHFDYAQGQTEYDGYIGLTNGQAIPAKTITDNRMVDIYTRHGAVFVPSTKTALIPYIDLGVSSWGRDIGASTPYRLTETFVHYAVGVGVNGFYTPFDQFVIHVGSGIGHTIIPLTLVSESILTLGAKPYYTAAVGLDIRITPRLHIRTDVDYRQWEYGRSDVEDDPVLGSIVEPRSETRRVRTLVSIGYGFLVEDRP